jgi:hypothetical protein
MKVRLATGSLTQTPPTRYPVTFTGDSDAAGGHVSVPSKSGADPRFPAMTIVALTTLSFFVSLPRLSVRRIVHSPFEMASACPEKGAPVEAITFSPKWPNAFSRPSVPV